MTLALMFLYAAMAIVLSPQTPTPIKTGTVEGRVMREGTNEPISGALVTLVAPGAPSAVSAETLERQRITSLVAGQSLEQVQAGMTSLLRAEGALSSEPAFVLTDAAGRFTFKDVPAGRYTLRAEREAFVSSEINETYQTGAVKNLAVEEGRTSSNEMFLVPSGIISGQVRDPLGQPAPGVTVGVFRLIYSSNGRKSFAAGRSVTTDDRGQYRIAYVAPGYLYVGVTPRTAPGSPEESWERPFYPGVVEPETAERIHVVIGGENSGINITLKPRGQTYKIRGRAINNLAVPNPTTGIIDRSVNMFFLSPVTRGLLAFPANYGNSIPVSSRPNGEFEIAGVRPGIYELSAYVVDSTRHTLLAHVPVEVRNEDVSGLSLAITAGAAFTGEVQIRGGAANAVPLQSLRLVLQTESSSLPVANIVVPVDAAGHFSDDRIPETRYRLQVTGLPADAYVADVLQGGLPVYDSGLDLDSRSGPIQVVVSPEGQTVTGTVATADGVPVRGATIVMAPPEASRQNTARFKTGTSDEQGRFVIRGVGPGQYTVYAWESIYPYSWLDEERLKKSANRGSTVSISSGGRTDLQLRAIPVGN
jgi:hypothetical protein